MKINIRSKLMMAISGLMVVVFALAANLFINEKKTELAEDIYLNTLAFAKLTASNVAYNYDLYLEENSFVYFNREIQTLFEQNHDLAAIKVVSYAGEILYDSVTDLAGKYAGEKRILDDRILLDQIKSESVSAKTITGEIFDLGENVNMEDGVRIDYFVVPATEKYSVIYNLTYENLDQRIALMVERIIYLAIFAVMLGMILSFFMSGHVSKPVGQLAEAAGKIAQGDFTAQVNIQTEDEIGFLGTAFNQMAKDLGKSVEAKVYKERVTRELELAANIQDRLVPDDDEIPKIAGLQISADLLPAEEIGGDIYDFIKVEDHRLLMYLGDVTGHGVPAGIVSSISSALFYGFAFQEDLKKVMVDVNKVLKVKTMPTMFLTLCLMQWDSLVGQFKYVSAGHEQLVHYRAAEKKASLKNAGGMALGMLPDISKLLKVEDVDFQPGDLIIAYSDGIPECWRNEKEIFGSERLLKSVEDAAVLSDPSKIKDQILADVKNFAAGYKQMDDITIMVVKRV